MTMPARDLRTDPATADNAHVALDLARTGLPVFPCAPDKRPLVKWRQAACSDNMTVSEWWRDHPSALVGLPTGERSGVYALDVDIDRETGEALGEASLSALGLGYLLTDPAQPRVRTASGGLHCLFHHPGEGLGNTAGTLGPKLDTRGEGGFIIAVGSTGPAGCYTAETAIDWRNLPPVPEILLSALTGHLRVPEVPPTAATAAEYAWGRAALQGELARVLAAPRGERNTTLNLASFRLGRAAAGGRLDGEHAKARLHAAGLQIGLDPREVTGTIASGFTAGHAAAISPEPRCGSGPGGPVAVREAPQPLLRETVHGKPYPVTALGPLRPAVEAVQGAAQAPVAIPAASALAVASLVVQGFADVETLGGPRPLSLYLLTVAQSGERKSSCDAPLMAGLRAFEKEQARAQRDAVQSWENAHALWKGERDRILAEAKKARGEKRTAARADLDALGPEPAAPPSTDRTATEPTFEGLTRLFATGQPALGIFSDEGGQFLGGHGMKHEARQMTLAALNDLWQGNPIRRTRGGDGHLTLYGRRLAVHLMAQPVVARGFMGDPLAEGTGFLTRFLICEPSSTIGTRFHGKAQPDAQALIDFSARLSAILETPVPMEADTRELQPRALPLSREARARLVQFSDTIEAAQTPGGSLAHVTGHASKAAEHAARLAGVLALWRDLHAPEVTAEEMDDGIALARFYLGEAARLADVAQVSAETERAEKLRRWLLDIWPHGEVTSAEVVNKGPNALREATRAHAALGMLERNGWLVPLDAGAVVRGKARKAAWRIVKGSGDVV